MKNIELFQISTIFILHIVLCIVAWILRKLKIIQTTSLIMPAVIFLPLLGFVMLLVEEGMERNGKMGRKRSDIEMLRMDEVRFQKIKGMEVNSNEEAVPLEEALVMNDAMTRRKLMLDILRKNPDEYVDLLQRTRVESDVEITHYATTTMMKLQTEYEQKLSRLDTRNQLSPHNLHVLKAYEIELQRYIKSGLLSATILRIYREKLKLVLAELMELEPEKKGYYFRQIDNELELQHDQNTKKLLEDAMKKWPQDERVYISYVKYYYMKKDGAGIKQILDQIKSDSIYLSYQGREWYAFWTQKEVANE